MFSYIIESMKEFIKALVSKTKVILCLPSTTFSGISWENGILNGLIVMELLKRGISRRVDFSVDIGRNGYSRRFYLSFT